MTGSNTRFSRHPFAVHPPAAFPPAPPRKTLSWPWQNSAASHFKRHFAAALQLGRCFCGGNVNGELALAAVGATSTAINFYLTAITGFTLGLSILFAQKYGSQKTMNFQHPGCLFLLLGGIFLVLSLAGFFLTRLFCAC